MSRGRVKRYSGRTLPVGILDKVFCSRASVELGVGDLIVMLSDGLEGESARIERLLSRSGEMQAEDLCRAVMEDAAGSLRDDATVLVARVAAQ